MAAGKATYKQLEENCQFFMEVLREGLEMMDTLLEAPVVSEEQVLRYHQYVAALEKAGLLKGMIIKVQQALYPQGGPILIYNEDRSVMEQFDHDPESPLAKGFEQAKAHKYYAHARYWADGRLQLVRAEDDQPW